MDDRWCGRRGGAIKLPNLWDASSMALAGRLKSRSGERAHAHQETSHGATTGSLQTCLLTLRSCQESPSTFRGRQRLTATLPSCSGSNKGSTRTDACSCYILHTPSGHVDLSSSLISGRTSPLTELDSECEEPTVGIIWQIMPTITTSIRGIN